MDLLYSDTTKDQGKTIFGDRRIGLAVEELKKLIKLRNEEEERLKDALAKFDPKGIDVALERVGTKCEDVNDAFDSLFKMYPIE